MNENKVILVIKIIDLHCANINPGKEIFYLRMESNKRNVSLGDFYQLITICFERLDRKSWQNPSKKSQIFGSL